jgi:A/G-specific adenine glycosylase
MNILNQETIVSSLLRWWDEGHAMLPWRENRDPYAIWVSEIMLQQTQIATVIPYYERWMKRLPTIIALYQASLDDVLKLWEGLGYYSRARNLHAAAQIVIRDYGGKLPHTVAELKKLPGIGPYTAGAIASIAFDQPVPVLDGNIIRLFSRLIDLADDVTATATKRQLWRLAASLVPERRPGVYNQALMELGQECCRPVVPQCSRCPLEAICLARQRGTEQQRPVRPPRKRIPHYDVVAGIIWRGEERSASAPFMIAQRPLDGLLGGLWEFPGGKQEAGESLQQTLRREIREELAIDITVGQQLTIVKHAYTHFRITLHALHARLVSGAPQHVGVADHAWVTLTDLDNFAFATADRQIIAALRTSFLA